VSKRSNVDETIVACPDRLSGPTLEPGVGSAAALEEGLW
jgi:hypothetical protein